MTETAWSPTWAVPPGETLRETLKERGVSQAELARRMHRPAKTISEIVRGIARITPETAIGLERELGVSASLWVTLEARYRLQLAAAAAEEVAALDLDDKIARMMGAEVMR